MGIFSLLTKVMHLLIDMNLMDFKIGNHNSIENQRQEAESHFYCCSFGQGSIWLKRGIAATHGLVVLRLAARWTVLRSLVLSTAWEDTDIR